MSFRPLEDVREIFALSPLFSPGGTGQFLPSLPTLALFFLWMRSGLLSLTFRLVPFVEWGPPFFLSNESRGWFPIHKPLLWLTGLFPPHLFFPHRNWVPPLSFLLELRFPPPYGGRQVSGPPKKQIFFILLLNGLFFPFGVFWPVFFFFFCVPNSLIWR